MLFEDRVSSGVAIFTHEHTAGLHDRQLAILRRIVASCETGFRFRELPSVCALVDLVNLRVEAGHVVFEAPLCDLISLCGRPIVREKVG